MGGTFVMLYPSGGSLHWLRYGRGFIVLNGYGIDRNYDTSFALHTLYNISMPTSNQILEYRFTFVSLNYFLNFEGFQGSFVVVYVSPYLSLR